MATTVNLSDAFTQQLYEILGKTPLFAGSVSFTALIGRNYSAGEALDTITDSTGLIISSAHPPGIHELLTTGAPINATGVAADLGPTGSNLAIGEVREVYSLPADNSDPTIQIAASTQIYTVHLMLGKIKNAAAAANRTLQLTVAQTLGIGSWLIGYPEYASAATAAIIISQYGGICWLPNGLQSVNINGTFTNTVGGSPLPVKAPGTLGPIFNCLGTTKNAADRLSLHVLIERVA